MKWVTREHIHVDRVTCPWLIRKFVDPKAEFLFVPADQVLNVDKREASTFLQDLANGFFSACGGSE